MWTRETWIRWGALNPVALQYLFFFMSSFCDFCAATQVLFFVSACLFYCLEQKSSFSINKVQLDSVCSVELGHIVSLHHTHFLPITACHLSPPPLPLHSLLRLVGSSLYKLLFTLSKSHPTTPPSPSTPPPTPPPPLKPLHSSFIFCFCWKASHTW